MHIKLSLTALMLAILVLLPIMFAEELKPIEGATVTVYGDNGEGFAVTDYNGLFKVVEGLGEGIYTARISAKGFISKSIENILVKAGETRDLGDIELKPSATIMGIVETPDGKPVPSVPVFLKNSEGKIIAPPTITSSNGAFIFDTDVTTGTYIVEAYPFSFEGFTFQTISLGPFGSMSFPAPKAGKSFLEGFSSGYTSGISVVQGGVVDGVVVKLTPSGIISGRVTDTQDNPIANVIVIAFQPKGEGFNGFFALTDSNGRYRIANNLPTGDYNVTLLFPKGYVWKFTDTRGVHVVAGKETGNVDFKLEKSGVISGVVVCPGDIPVANVTVIAVSKEYFSFTFTGIDGKFRIDSGLGSGSYEVIAYAGGFTFSRPVSVDVTAGQETGNIRLSLPTCRAAAIVEGRVTDINGKPIMDAAISTTGGSTRTGSDGRYQLTVELPGNIKTAKINIQASKRGYETSIKEVQITAGEITRNIDFTLTPMKTGVITGRVVYKTLITPTPTITPTSSPTTSPTPTPSPSPTPTTTPTSTPASPTPSPTPPPSKGLCVIATATFGSELSPEVEFLRWFRDGLILRTYSGKCFYTAFNAFYYSWSPNVAGFISQNEVFRSVVDLMLYPLIGLLKLTALSTIPIFQIAPEVAAITAGFIASTLIALIYIVPIIFLLILKGVLPSRIEGLREISKALWQITALVILTIIIGLNIGSPPLLTISTSIYVLLVMVSTTITAIHLIQAVKTHKS